MGVLFLGLWFSVSFLGGCGGCVLPSGELSWDPDRGGHWSFKQIKCFSRYWYLALKKEDGLRGNAVRGSTGGRKSGLFP